jgi:alkanesulfonate monooxygenase SsuD/methylene tetrahydromethanopterin reductase-like flavin-dependent oxidoreductase (luciferase family)
MEFWTGAGGGGKNRMTPGAIANGYETAAESAATAERMGFDGVSAAEHHFMYDAFMPQPLQALAAAAAATSKVRLLTGAMLLPLYDPIEAAEQGATLDVLSDGRVTMGLGMGYRPLEFDGFATAKRTRGARLVEAMEVIRLATSQDEFSYEGKHYQYSNVVVLPRSVQRPIEMYFCSGASPLGARRAARAGVPYWLANSPSDHAESMINEYRKIGRDAGWPEEQLKVAVFKDICIGDTIAQAEEMREFMLKNFYEEHILGYGYLVDEKGNHLYNPPKDHPIYQRFRDSIFCATTEMAIEEVRRFEKLGVHAIYMGNRDEVAEKIMPEFK